MSPEQLEQSKRFRIQQSQAFYNSTDSYRPMMSDTRRNEFYNEILKQVKGKVVLDIGAGIGALSLAALDAGASHVYAVECNPSSFKFLEDLKAGNKLDKLTIINSASWDLQLPEKVDFIVHEIFGAFLLDELCLLTLDEIKHHLKPGGKFLPEEFGFIFKPYSLETQVESVKNMNKICSFYNKLNKGQVVVEDIISDSIQDNSIEFGPFKFDDYPLDELENSITTNKEITMDSLWVIPYVKSQSNQLFICRQETGHHWGNSFLGFGKYVTLEPRVTINLKFWIDQNLASFNTGLSLGQA
jgi:protein arginine N-methyltransferase 1